MDWGVKTKAARTLSLVERLSGRPLAVHPERFRGVLAGVGLVHFDGDEDEDGEIPARVTSDGVAVVDIRGPLLAHGSWLTRWLGWPDFEGIGQLADRLAADERVRGVVLAIDSPGGEVAGAFEAAAKLAALAAAKPVVAVADHSAFSAGFLLAAQAEKVFVSIAGGVGSVGVVWPHVDVSQADHQHGVKVTFIQFGDKKTDGNAHEPLSERARADMQRDVDRLGEMFVENVAAARGMTADAVRGFEAGTFDGQDAVDAGLADEVGTLQSAIEQLSKRISASEPESPFGRMAVFPRSLSHVG